jgi:LmbE family N-acetylglucosaminyl deacetylase
MSEVDDRRLMLVHAHPDDESIETGATDPGG